VVLGSTPLQFSDANEIESADQRSVFLGKVYFPLPGKGIAAIEFTGQEYPIRTYTVYGTRVGLYYRMWRLGLLKSSRPKRIQIPLNFNEGCGNCS